MIVDNVGGTGSLSRRIVPLSLPLFVSLVVSLGSSEIVSVLHRSRLTGVQLPRMRLIQIASYSFIQKSCWYMCDLSFKLYIGCGVSVETKTKEKSSTGPCKSCSEINYYGNLCS